MPIRRQHRWLYPIDWPQISVLIRFGRANGRCEACGRPHGQLVRHLGDGRWWDEFEQVWRNGRGRVIAKLAPPVAGDDSLFATRVFLAAAHLDHDPGNNRPRNLKAFCQRCHMLHDREEHRRRRWLTLRMCKAMGDLFLGRYPVVSGERRQSARRVLIALPLPRHSVTPLGGDFPAWEKNQVRN